jgi:hypothetical protein
VVVLASVLVISYFIISTVGARVDVE